MIRSLLIALAIAGLVIGCSGPAAPTPAPSVAPTLGVTTPLPATPAPATPTATAEPTIEPSAEPTAEPTTEPTVEATAEPTAEPTPEVTEPPAGAGDILFADEMDDETSGWGVGVSGPVSVNYVNGSLQLDVDAAGQSVWSTRTLSEGFAVASIVGEFRPVTTDGAFGPLCEGDDGSLYGVAVTADGSISFVVVENNQTEVLKTFEELVDLPPVGGFLLGVECSGLATAASGLSDPSLRLVAVGAEGPLAVYQNNEGPQTFGGVAMYAEATGDSFRVDVDLAVAYGIPGSAEGMTSEGELLLTHVPGDLQSTCYQAPSSGSGTAVQHCVLQVEGTGAELLEFTQHVNNDAMNASYQDSVEKYGVESTGTCTSGPNETTWSIDNTVRGRVQCAPQQVGIRFDWTDDQLAILSTLIDFDGDYENTYNLWVDAGPVDSPI